jgi:predicted nucleic acid-binding protein
MSNTIIASDAGPLITLERLENGFDFLNKVYKEVIVPQSVFDEVLVKKEDFYNKLRYAGKIEVVQVTKVEEIPNIELLHQGEIDAISLAYQQKLPLLIEESLGRDSAKKMGIKRSGIGGVILKAYKSKLIDKQDALDKLNTLKVNGRLNKSSYTLLVNNID